MTLPIVADKVAGNLAEELHSAAARAQIGADFTKQINQTNPSIAKLINYFSESSNSPQVAAGIMFGAALVYLAMQRQDEIDNGK